MEDPNILDYECNHIHTPNILAAERKIICIFGYFERFSLKYFDILSLIQISPGRGAVVDSAPRGFHHFFPWGGGWSDSVMEFGHVGIGCVGVKGSSQVEQSRMAAWKILQETTPTPLCVCVWVCVFFISPPGFEKGSAVGPSPGRLCRTLPPSDFPPRSDSASRLPFVRASPNCFPPPPPPCLLC